MIIQVQGVVGAGKTTLANLLGEKLPTFEVLRERLSPVNPFLEKFYADPKHYAFSNQVFMMTRTVRDIQDAVKAGKDIILDISPEGNLVFGKVQRKLGIMDEDHFETYTFLFSTLKNSIPEPDLFVYLHCTPDIAVQRIIKRGRTYELDVPMSYWCELYLANEELFEEYSGRKLKIDVNNLNIVDNQKDKEYVLNLVLEALNLQR